MGCGLIWTIVGYLLSGGGLVFSYHINKRTRSIKEEMTSHVKDKAFVRIRKDCISQLQTLSNTIPPTEKEDCWYFGDKVLQLDAVLSRIETQCMKLSDEDKKKIHFIRDHIKKYLSDTTKLFNYGIIAHELNDIISKLEGDENYDKER